jgi:hypothetical protein
MDRAGHGVAAGKDLFDIEGHIRVFDRRGRCHEREL